MCLGALFMETAPRTPEHEKCCLDISCLERTGMRYVTRRSHRMQNHKLDITCPSVLFVESVPSPPEHEK
jgi:hypothetical protein